ncbi:uncharacterized protein LOC129601502 [Paramacrobiotus metropolitanus]|uniref:uncharacterized protein LOC129601502 n=1 Tax=Paramacrobiotus metropolitanus TaxID=2943436 RepID=UPI0024459814|nr:uncharacterized protein LOC129601502 [Paramacrobiotus metropolitanus]
MDRRGAVRSTMQAVASLLKFKSIRLPIIQIKDCAVTFELYTLGGHHRLQNLDVLMPSCRKLLVSNYAIRYPLCDCCTFHHMVNEQATRPEEFPLLIPKMLFDGSAVLVKKPAAPSTRGFGARFPSSDGYSDDLEGAVRSFGHHVDNELPLAEWDMDQLRQQHTAMVDTWSYPSDWQGFRKFLQWHTFDAKQTSTSFWENLDLRDFDSLPLSRYILHFLQQHRDLSLGQLRC